MSLKIGAGYIFYKLPSDLEPDYCRFQVNKDGSGDVLSGSGLREEGVERVISTPHGLVRRHLPVRLDS